MKRRHDNFFRTIFSEPKYARKLLQLAAKKNESLAHLLSLINLETLRQIPGDAPREGLGGNADVAFHVNLQDSKDELFVGIVLEHKSFPDYGIREQLLKYYFEVMEQKTAGTPMVAIVVYNGKERWQSLPKPYTKYPKYFQEVGLPFKVEFIDIGTEISTDEFNELEPMLKLALVAMRYVFNALGTKEKFSTIVGELIRSPRGEIRKIVEEVIVYLKDSLLKSEKEVLMDTLEALRNKGFESIADAEEKELEELRAEKAKLRAEKVRLHDEIGKMCAEIGKMNAENEKMCAENEKISAEKTNQAKEIEALKRQIAELQAKLA